MTTFEHKTNFRPAPAINPTARDSRAREALSLTQAVQTAVREVDETLLRRVARTDAGLAFQPKTLLAMLTYCYARGIYGSGEVEDLMRRDVNFRELCHNEFPDARVIRRFRRHNRELLHSSVMLTLQLLYEQNMTQGAIARINDLQIAEEANRRITMAMFMDTLDLDND